MRREWFPVWRGRAGVEEIVGFAGPWGLAGSGMGMLLGSRTATRDLWSRAVFRMPLVGRRGPVGLGSCPGGARGGLRTG